MHVLANNVCDAWIQLLQRVMTVGQRCAPRGKEIRELLHTMVTVTSARNNIITHPQRDLNYKFMVAEWLWIQSGREDLEWIQKFNKNIVQFSDDGKTFRGAYGPRFRRQVDRVIDLLRRDPDSRQAVIQIFDAEDLVGTTRDVPCTVSLQLSIRRDEGWRTIAGSSQPRLHGVMTMRSNDLWLGFPYDFFNFSQITNSIAGELDVEVGSFTLQAGSSHVYATDYEKAIALLEPPSGKPESAWEHSPRLSRLAPPGITMAVESAPSVELNSIETAYVQALQCPTKAAALQVLKLL